MATAMFRISRIVGRSYSVPVRNASVYIWGSSSNGQIGVGEVEKSGMIMQSKDGKNFRALPFIFPFKFKFSVLFGFISILLFF